MYRLAAPPEEGGAEHLLHLAMHHIVSDGWSKGVLTREITALYAAFLAGRPSPLPELEIQYADFALWQRRRLQGEVLDAELAYWRHQLAGAPVLELPADRPRPPVQSFRGGGRSLLLSPERGAALRQLCRDEGTTLFMTLLAAFDVLFQRASGQDDVVVGSVIANRNRAELEGLIGFFVNALALRVDLAGDPSFRTLLDRAREVVLGAFAHQDLPFEKLVAEIQPERDLSRSPLFQVAFVVQNAPAAALQLPGLAAVSSGSPEDAVEQTAKYDLLFTAVEHARGGVRLSCSYAADLFEAATVARLLEHAAVLLDGVAAHPETRLSGLVLLTPAERQQTLVEWNATAAEVPAGVTVVELFAAQAARTPEAPAVIAAAESLTYRDLDRRAGQLARRLQLAGVGPEVVVALGLERSPALVVAALAVLKAGGAYLPLDPANPPERLAFMVADSGARLLLTSERLRGRFPAELPAAGPEVLLVDGEAVPAAPGAAEAEPEPPVRAAVDPANLAYVIYTSGSTGRPKGTLLSHAGLVNLAAWLQRAYGITPGTRATLLAGVGFDASVFETWPYLTAGASLWLPPAAALADPKALLAGFAAHGITHSFLPTPLAELVLAEPLPPGLALRHLHAAGDRLRRRPAAGTPFALHNLYGPTENSVASTGAPVAPVQSRTGEGAPTIGRPIANVQTVVLDRSLQPAPAGVPGQLYLAGASLARGYLGRPDLTAAAFRPHAWSAVAGARLYSTGDLVRWTAAGELEFLGRIDHQVKVRGLRIELGEVESALAAHPAVREAVVLAREERPGEHRLVAYAVAAGEAPDGAALAADLGRDLPEYMVPADVVWLESLPLTPNGKVDRRALAAIAPDRRQGAPQVAPRTPIEEVIAAIWQELLGLEAVGVHDSFFRLGGHSLLATQLISRVRSTFQVELPLRRLFEEPTVEALAAAVAAGEARPGQSEKIARVLLRIKGLPEDARQAARTSA